MSHSSPNADLSSPSLNLSYDLRNHVYFKQNDQNYILGLSAIQLPSVKTGLLDIYLSQGHSVEPHWHPNAAELVYAIQGEALVYVLNPFTLQLLKYRITPGQVANVPKAWWHWEIATKDQTHLLAIFDTENPEVIFGSDILRKTPKDIMELAYCLNGDQIEQALKPLTETVIIGPPTGCSAAQVIGNKGVLPSQPPHYQQPAFPTYPQPQYVSPGYPPLTQPSWPPASSPTEWRAPAMEDALRTRQQPLTFVLVHGAWADSSFWDEISAELRKMGHTVYAPEYAGHGADPNKAVTHAMMTKSIADFITSHNLRDIVLVGHSFGGTLVQKTAELVPDRIKRLVFLNAFVLKDGQSPADEFPPSAREGFKELRKNSKNDTIMLPFPLFRDTFVNLGSLEFAKQLYDRISPEPAKPLYEKLDLKKFYSLKLPKSYVYLTEDNVLPQTMTYGWHPHMSSRLGLFRLIKDNGDHMTTAKTEPAKVARSLYAAGRD